MIGRRWIPLGVVVAALALLAAATAGATTLKQEPEPLAALGTAFTYQGRLTHDGQPVDGACDFQFSLYATDVAPNPIDKQPVDDVPVADGLFTVHLDFGPVPFQGEERWLGIAVACPAGSGAFAPLSDRQLLSATPYALYARAAPWDGLSGVPADFADGVDDDTFYAAGDGLTLTLSSFSLLPTYQLPQTCADGQVSKWEAGTSLWVCGDDNVGGGEAAWLLTGNAGTQSGVDVLGTTDPVSLSLVVDSGPVLRLEYTGLAANIVAGDPVNSVTPGAWAATIGGGGDSAEPNRVSDKYGTVGGGSGNQAGNGDGLVQDKPWATVGGGRANAASGGYATVGGGYRNQALGNYATIAGGGPGDVNYPDTTNNRVTDSYGTIGGGGNNQAGDGDGDVTNTRYATVGGGWGNQASGDDATVGGGYGNEATGDEAAIAGGVANDATGYAAAVGGGLGNQAAADFATIAGGGRSDVTDPNTANRVTDGYGTIGGGGFNLVGDDDGDANNAPYATVGGGGLNTASGYCATVGGGHLNQAIRYASTVAGGDGNTASGDWAAVGGGYTNVITGSGGTISGGYTNTISGTGVTISGGYSNTGTADYATVGGGSDNQISSSPSPWNYAATYATISGGYHNSVSGYERNMLGATIGGGVGNTASANYAAIGGGVDNTSDGQSATIAGGDSNTVGWDASYSTIGGGQRNAIGESAFHATVPGGYDNTAAASGSFAAGSRAKANHQGAFVWADSTNVDFVSERAKQFRIRANGGARFDVNSSGWVNIYSQSAHDTTVLIDTSTGAHLTTGGTWTNSSDRNGKENLAPVDGQEVLARLAQVPVSTWNYKAEDPSVRHMGPLAQDFYQAFGLGSDDKTIGTLDAEGVALAAIQGLYDISQERAGRIEALEAESAAQQEQIDDLEARLAALEKQSSGGWPRTPLGWLLPGCLLAAVAVIGRRQMAGGGR